MPEDVNRPQLTAEAVPLPLCVVDLQGRMVDMNSAFAGLAGLARAGGPIADLDILPEWALAEALDRIASGMAPCSRPLPGTGRVRGRSVLLSVTGHGGASARGLIVTILPSVDGQIAEQEQRASFALESAGQWIWELDIATRTVWRSEGWQRALGFRADERVDDGEPWGIVHPDDRDAAAAMAERVIAGEAEMFEATYRLRHRDGSWRWFLSRGRIATRRPDGRPERLLATTIDVHRQKESEERLTAAIAESAEISRRLAALNSQLTELSDRDGLTGLSNRRAFEREWRLLVVRSAERGEALSLVMIDVDFFKQFNDRMGHLAGDECLRNVATLLARAASRSDLVCRYGGEEFAVLLAGAGAAEAGLYAGRVMEAVEHLAEPHPASPFGRLTISIGLATLASGEAAERLLQRADDALYEAKRAGRNRIGVARAHSGRSVSA